MFVSTIIVAAGSSRRFGNKPKKQFAKLLNRPVYLWSVEKFLGVADELILALPVEDIPRIKRQVTKYFTSEIASPAAKRRARNDIAKQLLLTKIKFVPGGKERFHSVKLALKHISPHSDLVCIHDAVRPLINQRDILRCIEIAKKFNAAICATQATNTIKISKDFVAQPFRVDVRSEGVNAKALSYGFSKFGRIPTQPVVDKTLDRRKVWLAQTPQIFKKELILKAYSRPHKFTPTDDSQLVEKLGYRVRIVQVTSPNIKITTKQDLAIAEQLLKSFP